jgi:regulator of replication initiation timing
MQERREREEANRERARRQRREAQEAARAARESADPDEVVRLRERVDDLGDLLRLAEEERDEAARLAEQAAANELRIIEESDELIARATSLGERVAQLETENGNLRENLRAIHRYEEEEAEAGDGGEPVPETVDSWEEVAAHLEDLAGPGFHLTQRAIDCADGKNRYPHPGAVWESLRALERVGRAYNELGAKIDMRFDAFALEVGGLDVALQDSTYDGCWFEYEGNWYERLPHVKIDDAKSPNEVGRIYFALDSAGQRLIVDWFGTKPDRPTTRRPG